MNRTFCVLLVEDDPVLGETCTQGLTLLGHRVLWVRSVAAAFETLSLPHAVQVVLLDLGLGEER
jgi:DNA-binding response OmpR family regulator